MCKTYKPYTLVGPTVPRPVPDPLAVLHLVNQLYIGLGEFIGKLFWIEIQLLNSALVLRLLWFQKK